MDEFSDAFLNSSTSGSRSRIFVRILLHFVIKHFSTIWLVSHENLSASGSGPDEVCAVRAVYVIFMSENETHVSVSGYESRVIFFQDFH